MSVATMPVREDTGWKVPPEAPPAAEPAPARPGPLSAEELVAMAVAAGTEDPEIAAERVFAAADGSRSRLRAAASLLIQRLKNRSDDLEASLALRIVERALVRAPYPDGPWRWAENLNPRRVRAAERRRRRMARRGRTGPRRSKLPFRLPFRAGGRTRPAPAPTPR